MAKSFNTLFLMSRRAYAATVENVKLQLKKRPILRKVAAETNSPTKEVFWMRDPNTGNWIPENHFGQVDPVDLRNQLLPNKLTS